MKVPHLIGFTTGSITNNMYCPAANTSAFPDTTEAKMQIKMTHPGTFSGLRAKLAGANAGSITNITLRVNGVDTALTVSVPLGSTDPVSDLVNEVHVNAGDLVTFHFSMSSFIARMGFISFLFEADSGDSVQYNASSTNAAISYTASPRYEAIAGMITNKTAENFAQSMAQHAGVITHIGGYVYANTRTSTNITLRVRKGAVNGNIQVAIPASTTGHFLSSGGTPDSFVAGNLLNSILTFSGGAGALSMSVVQFTVVSTNPREVTMFGGNSTSRSSTSADIFLYPAGRIDVDATEANMRMQLGVKGVASNLAMSNTANTNDQAITFRWRKGGVNGNQNFSMGAGVTGWFQDNVNSDDVEPDDIITLRSTKAAGTGTTSLRCSSFKFLMALTDRKRVIFVETN